MKASKLRQRISFLELTDTTSSSGASTQSWEVLTTVYASFEPLSVRDILNAKASKSEVIARCVLRYRPNINSTMRVKHKGELYEIEGNPLTDSNSGTEYMTLTLKQVK